MTKAITALAIVMLVSVVTGLQAQTVTIHAENEPLMTVLKEITKQTEIPTWAGKPLHYRPVTVDLENATFDDAISAVAQAANCMVVMDAEVYVLKDSGGQPPMAPALQAPKRDVTGAPVKAPQRPRTPQAPKVKQNRALKIKPGTFKVIPKRRSILGKRRPTAGSVRNSKRRRFQPAPRPLSLTPPDANWTLKKIRSQSVSTVKNKEQIEKTNALIMGYDDGQMDGKLALTEKGSAVLFEAPAKNWTINQVAVFGMSTKDDTPQEEFAIHIVDKKMRLFSRSTHAYNVFPEGGGWAVLEMPHIRVSEPFYVIVYPNPKSKWSLSIGYDSSLPNRHSELVTYMSPARWELPIPKQKVNWMIRVVGTTPLE